jgi:hypothetical protein
MADDNDNAPPFDLISISEVFGALPPPTRAQRKLMSAAERIALEEAEAADRAFLARQFVQCTLPHTNPGNVPQWTRTCRNVTLGIQPGRDYERNVSLGYPYGSLPRLILFWLNTEAVRTKSRRLHLGRSFTDFMRQLGLDPDSRGKRSDARRLREQMRRLFSAHIGFQYTAPGHDKPRSDNPFAWINMDVAQEGELWWDTKAPQQAGLFESWIQLGEKLYEAIIASPVPVDLRALRALKRSPLALDLYAWATYSTHSVTKEGKPRRVSWKSLAAQFGADYDDVKDFKKKINKALLKVQTVYPALRLSPTGGGVIIAPSRTSVLPIDR